jgi:hypothetical protein
MDNNLILTNINHGYDLANSDQAAKDALQTAFMLVKKSRRTGAETRMWAAELLSKVRKLLWSYNAWTHQQEVLDQEKLSRKIGEISCWETDIHQVLRSYMTITSEILTQVKALNPPLATHQLRPFLDAIDMDRKGTMASLEPLAHKTNELINLKSRLMAQGA